MRGWPVLLMLSACVAAQTPVVRIAVEPPPGRAAAEFARLVTQPLGAALDPAAVGASLRALYATGEFAAIEAVTAPAPGGEALTFRTRPTYFLALVRVTGSPDPPADTELEDASGLALGGVYTPALLTDATAKIRERLRSYGYYDTTVIPQVSLVAATAQATINFQVHAGAPAVIGAVSFSGALLFPAAELARASRLRTGQALTRDRMDAAAAALQAYYAARGRLAARITLSQPDYHAAGHRADLTFTLDPGPPVAIRLEGARMSPGKLRDLLPMFEEHAVDSSLIEEGRRNLVAYLQGKGYFEAAVDDRQSTGSDGTLDIVYSAAPGPKERLDAVEFAGNQYFPTEDLAERVAVRAAAPLAGLLPGIVPGGAEGRFSSAMAAADSDAIARLYRDNGFAAVQVRPVVDRAFDGKPGHVVVTFRIQEGPQTLVRHLRLQGATAANQAALKGLLTTAPGQPYAPSSLAADRNTILTYYYNSGYQGASCDVASIPATAAAEDVVFTIHEGRLQTIHRVFIAGNRFVHRNVIAHDLQLGAGQPLGQLAMLNSQRALYDSGLFTSASVVARNPSGAEAAKDVIVSVNEARRYTFGEGVGLQVQGGTGGTPNRSDVLGTTGYSPLLSFDMTRTAMTGRQQTLSLKSTYGTLQKRAVLGYDMPDFLNRANWRADLTTFYDDTFDVRTFRAIREQAGVQLEQTLTPSTGWTYNLDYRRVRVLSPQVAPQEIPVLSQPVQVGALSATYHRDHRDDALDTHEGTFNSVQFGLANTFGRGFANFGRIVAQNRWYHPLNNDGTVVLARATQIGLELPFGQRQTVVFTNPVTGASSSSPQYVLPLPERFLAGGADTLRGFSINQAGPRDPVTAFPVGGEALLVNNLELRFPLIGDTIGGVVFYDVGNVYSTPRQMLRALLRWRPPAMGRTPGAAPGDDDFTSHTVGLGLRYRTPVGPVRIDTGYLLNPPSFAYFSSGTTPVALTQKLPPFHFFFSIGQTF